jgi:hypothetical protein
LRDNIQGVDKPVIRRLARRCGFCNRQIILINVKRYR